MPDYESSDNPLTSFAVGTQGYASPEQMMMRPTYASDIYSLGVTCIYLLTGKSPKDIGYDAQTGALNWEKQVTISSSLKQVLQKMLDISVRDRYQSAQAVRDALELEANSETFSQGLAQPKPIELTDPEDQEESNYYSDKTSKLAESIRKRRSRQGLPTSRSQREGHSSGGILKGGQSKSGLYRKLTADDVINQYQKGRRDFSQIYLYHLNLEGTKLNQGIFRNSNLRQINFQKAELKEADFANAILARANLPEAKLNNAFFSQTDLEKVDLRKADLTMANFQDAKLSEANLCGANLTNANISDEQLAQAKTNWATILPNGKRAFFN